MIYGNLKDFVGELKSLKERVRRLETRKQIPSGGLGSSLRTPLDDGTIGGFGLPKLNSTYWQSGGSTHPYGWVIDTPSETTFSDPVAPPAICIRGDQATWEGAAVLSMGPDTSATLHHSVDPSTSTAPMACIAWDIPTNLLPDRVVHLTLTTVPLGYPLTEGGPKLLAAHLDPDSRRLELELNHFEGYDPDVPWDQLPITTNAYQFVNLEGLTYRL